MSLIGNCLMNGNGRVWNAPDPTFAFPEESADRLETGICISSGGDRSDLLSPGNFPHHRSFFQNPRALIDLSTKQVSMPAHLSCRNILANADEFSGIPQ